MTTRVKCRDYAGGVSPLAASILSRRTEDANGPLAVFSAGHVAKEHPEGLRIHSPSGEHVATMHGAHSAQIVDGLLHVFRKPRSATGDQSLGDRLRQLNLKNQEFYRRKP